VVYKIQIGLYKKLDMSSYLAEPKFIGLEKDGDKNRYVVSYFREKEEAVKFVTELRRLGIRGAFVAKYENGERSVPAKSGKRKSKTPAK
jgi:hypothetical protein